jgi:hypothetical protein
MEIQHPTEEKRQELKEAVENLPNEEEMRERLKKLFDECLERDSNI